MMQQKADPCLLSAEGLSTGQGGRPPGKAGPGPKLTAALCLPILRRNFPSLMDGQADKMCNLYDFKKESSITIMSYPRVRGQWLSVFPSLVPLLCSNYKLTGKCDC